MKSAALCLIIVMMLIPCGAVAAEDLAVKVTVAEPAGVARKAEPASGGIPFKKGQVKNVDELALFDKDGKAVPAQFSLLAPYEDGSVQWALVDLLVDLPANGRAEFVVKKGKAALPDKPLKPGETMSIASAIQAWGFSGGERCGVLVTGWSGCAVIAPKLVTADGKTMIAWKATKTTWEYKGPLRATVRIDGFYADDAGKPYIDYTTRLTFWAGRPWMRMVHTLRNSNPTDGFDAKIKEATIGVSLQEAKADLKGSGLDWAQYVGEKANLFLTHRHTAGCFPGGAPSEQPPAAPENPAGKKPKRPPALSLHKLDAGKGQVTVWTVPPAPENPKGYSGYGAGHFALADLAHKESELWFVFEPVTDAAAMRTALLAPLHVLADGAWISETDALGPGKFGTFEDEKQAYKNWGWTGWDDPAKQAPARKAHVPDAFISHVDIHDESEADSVELFGLMYVRTGERGFLDMAAAYAGYFRGHAVWRTDGFVYDGFRHERAGVVAQSRRKSTALAHGWYGPKEYDWSDSRFHMCHQWATGLIDYYCLTGDVDALEAGLDWAEYAAATHYDQKPGWGMAWGRAWGRSFGIIVRAYQVTRDPKWKALADTYAQVAIKAPNRQPDGLFKNGAGSMTDYFIRDNLEPRAGKEPPIPPRLKEYMQEKGLTYAKEHGELVFADKAGKKWPLLSTAQSFEYEACATAVARYAEVMDSDDARKLVIDMAKCARTYYWSTKCEHAIPHPYIGFPDEGKLFDRAVWDDSHKNCPNDPGGAHSGYHTRFLTDIFARAYAVTGDKEWLDWAKKAWNRGSKRGYWTPSQSFPDDVVATFVGHDAPKGDHIDIRNSMRLFYEAAHTK